MNSNNNAQVLKRKENVPDEFVTMQSAPAVGYTPASLPSDPMSASQSLYPQSYNFPTYDGAPTLPNPYSRDGMFSASVASTTPSSLPFGDITPPLFGSGMLGTHPYSTQGLLPSRTAPGLLNYGQSGMQASQPHLFPGASPYGGYPAPLSMPLHAGQPMDRYLLSNPAHMMQRFPGLHPTGSNPLGGFRESPGIRPPFNTSLLPDRKPSSHSPLTNVSNGNELESRGDINGSRKKRKACGHCGPCQRKENCGSCMNCVNRAKGKQICIHRKCEILKKKPGSAPYTPTRVDPPIVKQEKRKEIDNFSPNEPKRSKLEPQAAPQGGELPQGLLHPTLHPNFAEFGDLNRTPTVPQTGQTNPIPEQSAQQYQPRLPVSSNQAQTDLRPPFYSENSQQQQLQQQSQQQLQQQSQQQSAPAQFPTNHRSCEPTVDGQPVNEESDFINQALQAIESNITCHPSPEGNNSLSDTSNPALSASTQSQEQSQNPLQSPQQQRRASVHDPSFNSWNPDLRKANVEQSSQMPAQASAQSSSSSPRQAQQGLPDQLLNNLRKFNSPTSFHAQQHGSPVKDPAKLEPFPVQTPQYGQNPHRLSTDNQQPTPKEQTNFSQQQQSRQYPQGQAANANQYPGDMPFIRPSEPNTRVPSYEQSNPSTYNQMFSLNPSQRPYGAQSYPNNPAYSQTRPTNSRIPYEQDYGNKQHTPNSISPGQYPYSQPRIRAAYSNPAMPSQHGQTHFNSLQQTQNQYHRYPNPQFHPRGTNPDGHRLPNGQWVPHQQTSPQQQGISPQQAGAQPPSYIAPNRRTSTNQQSNYPPPRQMTTQPVVNPASNQSSLPSHSSNPAHSPYPGSVGSSLRSPAANVAPSPASQNQSESGSINMPHLASSPMATNPLCPTGVTTQSMSTGGDSSYPLQSYRPWHEPDKPGFNYHGHVSHTVLPPDGYKAAPNSRHMNANHFLAQPGSSPSYPPPIGQGGFPGDPTLPFAAARSSHPPGNTAAAPTQEYTSAHHAFAETMNSVLYGRPPRSKTHESSLGSISADKSTAESSPADPHLTISPGESGYDSAELSSVVSENLSHMSQKSIERSKNLCEAPVGSIVQQTPKLEARLSPSTSLKAGDEDATVSSGSLLPTGARVTQSHLSSKVHSGSVTSEFHSGSLNPSAINKNLPQATNFCGQSKTLSNELITRAKQRSFSLDCAQTLKKSNELDLDFGESDAEDQLEGTKRKVVSLRRFSSQGIGVSEGLKSNVIFKVPGDFKSQKQVFSKVDSSQFANKTNILSEENVKLNYATDIASPIHHVNQGHAFDTPPQTPTYPSKSIFENAADQKMTHTFANEVAQNQVHHNLHLSQNVVNNCNQSNNSMDFRGRVVEVKGQNGALIKKGVFPTCNCIPGTNGLNDDAPYYTHLGAAHNVAGIRKLFESRLGYTGKALRIEKVIPTDKEGKTSHGCPVAKWIIRRESSDEKVLVVCRQRKGHFCPMAVIVVIILLWDGIRSEDANFAYEKYRQLIPHHGQATDRRCATNEERTCACQGFDEEGGGASFSFGCSWSMYYNGCKYARSVNPNKFKLNSTKDPVAEADLTDFCQKLSSMMSILYKKAAPDGHRNQTEHENEGYECRLGCNPVSEGRPFSGFTCCMDFCAHAHKDQHNMENGVTMVLTLTKPENREIGKKPVDEQLHVLPLYKLDLTNEDGDLQGVGKKLKNGSIEILSSFRRNVRLRDKPLGNCKQRTNKKRKGDSDTTVKKRGRKPKRSVSMENLWLSSQKTPSTPPHTGFRVNQLPPPVQNEPWYHMDKSHTIHRQHYQNYGHDPISSPPPRWPYRRHISTDHDRSGPLSAESNLPSIGSIFSPGSQPSMTPTRVPSVTPIGLTPPSTPAHFPMTPSPQAFQFGRRISTQSLGSDHNVLSPLPALGGTNHLPSGAVADNKPTNNRPNMFLNQPGLLNPLTCMNHTQPAINHPGMVNSHFISNQQPIAMQQSQNQPSPESHKLNLKSYAASPLVKNENLTYYPGYCNPQMHPFLVNDPPPTTPVKREALCNSEESFLDTEMGGLALAPGHGSVLIECAKRELHATTSLMKPDRFNPSRISLVFYQHKNLNHRNHGAAQYSAKEAKRNMEKAEKLKKEKEEMERIEMEKLKAQQHAMMMQNPQEMQRYFNTFYSQNHGQIRLPSLNMSGNMFQARLCAPISSATIAPSTTMTPTAATQSGIATSTPLRVPSSCALQSTQRWSHPPNVSRTILTEKSLASSANTRHVLQQSLVNRQQMLNAQQQSQPSSETPPQKQPQNNSTSSNVNPPILGQFSCYPQNPIYRQQRFLPRGISPDHNFYSNLKQYPNHLLPPRATTPRMLPPPTFLPPKHHEIP